MTYLPQKDMKSFSLLLAVATLAGCTFGNRSAAVDPSPSSPPQAISAFEEICLKTAPTFARAASAAGAFGVTEFMSLGPAKMGFNRNQSLGVQIAEGLECTITTPTQSDKSLTTNFLQSVARTANASPAANVPFRADIAGQTFIFQHDRSGGEAYVMLKAGK
ncbi:hypothetical protein J2W23_003773 [Variovorax boronicumulans]|uniref:hypothetical protein n=1 Tax=Variovorax boronicumulans TaxID=436515 RepID=UPI0027851C46|nr:hypothetical protein [Variovorax boronicumulans]MDQ0015373.1 hypothetical protein [Variovorax boronicumulans]